MTIDYAEIGTDENWELFTRDFLAHMGFVIDIGPGRGADAGKDMVVIEQLVGRIASRRFRWLVSCKYFTQSGKAVGLTDEENIIERLRQHNANGFIGFYSTIASSPFIDRLHSLVQQNHIDAYEIFDRQKISARFYGVGLSNLALRYFSKSYSRVKPIQEIFNQYEPLPCDICGVDILIKSTQEPYCANVLLSVPLDVQADRRIDNMFIVCKGECDDAMQARLSNSGFMTKWEDVGDLCNPLLYLKNIVSYMNILHAQDEKISTAAHEKAKHIYLTIGQRVLREMTSEDKNRAGESLLIEGF